MSEPSINKRLNALQFFKTPEHICNYLPDQEASTVFVGPDDKLSKSLYSELSLVGFRRSGSHLYRPHCKSCNSCIPLRIAVADFKPNRAQKRVLKKNQDVKVVIRNNKFQQEHYELYERYVQTRHSSGGMDETSPDQYSDFLVCEWLDTRFVEFRLNDRLMGIAVTDFIHHSLSALYTFFDPDMEKRSPGILAVLWQIAAAKQFGKQWVYLGYWIEASDKMKYKTCFKPYELFINGHWQQPLGQV